MAPSIRDATTDRAQRPRQHDASRAISCRKS